MNNIDDKSVRRAKAIEHRDATLAALGIVIHGKTDGQTNFANDMAFAAATYGYGIQDYGYGRVYPGDQLLSNVFGELKAAGIVKPGVGTLPAPEKMDADMRAALDACAASRRGIVARVVGLRKLNLARAVLDACEFPDRGMDADGKPNPRPREDYVNGARKLAAFAEKVGCGELNVDGSIPASVDFAPDDTRVDVAALRDGDVKPAPTPAPTPAPKTDDKTDDKDALIAQLKKELDDMRRADREEFGAAMF